MPIRDPALFRQLLIDLLAFTTYFYPCGLGLSYYVFRMTFKQRVWDPERVIALFKRVVVALEVGQRLFMLGIVVRTVYFDVEPGFNDRDVDRLKPIELFQLRIDVFFAEEKIQRQRMRGGHFDPVAKALLAWNTKCVVEMIQGELLDPVVDPLAAVAAGVLGYGLFHGEVYCHTNNVKNQQLF